jgi:hypothetical protein
MDTIMILLAAGLFWAWILGPVIILHYRLVVIPRRYQEIRERFQNANPREPLIPEGERTKSAGWHYARLLHPASDPKDPDEVLRRQFFHFHGWNRYRFPLVSIIILSGLMLGFSGMWLAERLTSPVQEVPAKKPAAPSDGVTNSSAAPSEVARTAKDSTGSEPKAKPTATLLSRIPAPFVMALWGAYVWSLYEILSRRKSGDLTPVELYEIACRYVTAIPVGYAFSLLVFDTVPALAAFAISAFPLRDIRQFFRKQTLQKLNENTQATAAIASRGYLSEALFGIGNEAIARLQELDIETFLDLAYTDPVKLMIKTGAPIELVLSWIDQALVSVYALPHKAALALYGMPCALDLSEFYARHCYDVAKGLPKPWADDPAVQALATKLGVPADFIVDQTLRSVFEDPHTQFLIRVWYGPATPHTAL